MDDPPVRTAAERCACPECDLLVEIGDLRDGQRASCPRCGNLLTVFREEGPTRSLAFALAAVVLLLLANAFPFLELKASGLEQVMTLPKTATTLYRDGQATLAVLVLGPIAGVPALMLATIVALMLAVRRRRPAPWLVAAGRFLFLLSPWHMAEVFVIGVLVSLVKIAALASVVMGLSFWSYVGFAVCFTVSLASIDRLQIWRAIEACEA